MSVLVDKNTRLCVQGITGSAGGFHAKQCMEYGTNVVAGVTPGKGGQRFEGKVPVFDTVWEARQETGCNASVIFVPAAGAADGILEAVDAGVELVICITEGIPVIDMMRVKAQMAGKKSRLIGPNCPGIITPGRMQNRHHAGIHSHGRRRRRHLAQRDANLRGGLAVDLARLRAIDLHWHRRRPDQWHVASRRGEAFQ